MANLIPESSKKIFTPELLRSAAKQSTGCLVVPVRLRRAIKKYLRELEEPHVKKKVRRLSETFNEIKNVNLMLTATTSKEFVEDPLSLERSKRWKIKSAYGDIGFKYSDSETVAYVASRMPAVFSSCYRVLSEVRRRLPDFTPTKVLDFGAGTGSAFWAMRELWPKSIEKVNIVEPSQSMQRAGRSLLQGMNDLPLIHGYNSLQALSKDINKSEREHNLVIASYVLGEIPSLKDRITIVRQLWDLTSDVLVLLEPGTPHGSNIISQMRSYILWMEKRKLQKYQKRIDEDSKDLVSVKNGAFIVAPCSHDGRCPLEKSGKYCHFVQRLQRTSMQRAYKRSQGEPLRGFEDEKFSFVVFRRGQRPRQPWPLDGMKFETFKEQRMSKVSEELETEPEDLSYEHDTNEIPDEELNPNEVALSEDLIDEHDTKEVPDEELNPNEVVLHGNLSPVKYESDGMESDFNYNSDEVQDKETGNADVGGGWGRIIYMPVRRGRQVTMNVCRSTNQECSEGSFERIVLTRNKNPALHHQARRSLWGDLWPS